MANHKVEKPARKGHPRFYEIIKEMEDLHDRKNSNYSEDNDPLSNLKASERFGVLGSLGTMIRMSDKWSRLEQLMKGKKDSVGESIKDTLMDLAIYSILEIILLESEAEREYLARNP